MQDGTDRGGGKPSCTLLSFIRVWPVRAVNWGLRSPNSNDNNAYNINTDGTVNNNNVYNANFAPRPALMEHRVQVPARGKAEAHHQRRPYPVAASCMEDAASQDEHMVSTLTDPTPGECPRAPLWREVPPAISDAQRSSASKPSKDVQP